MAWFRTSGNNGGSLKVKTASGDIASFETNLVAPLQSVLVDVVASGGNGTPDNPNPINGYSSANITRCGVNLININGIEFAELQNPDVAIPFVDGLVIKGLSRDGYVRPANVSYSVSGDKVTINTSSSSYGVGFAFRAIPNTDYYVSCLNSFIAASVYYDKDGNWIGDIGTYVSGNNSFTTPNNCAWCVIVLKPNLINVDVDFNEPLVNVGTTKTTYHAYNGQTYTVSFGQTVYGGQLDVTRGKLTVTHLLNTYTGSADENWQKAGTAGNSQRFYIENQGEIKSLNSANSNYLTPVDTFDHAFGTFRFATNKALIVHDNAGDFSDVASFKAYLASHNLQICYELATPFNIDLTPEVISAIVGTNNVFADCGETTVKYLKRE